MALALKQGRRSLRQESGEFADLVSALPKLTPSLFLQVAHHSFTPAGMEMK